MLLFFYKNALYLFSFNFYNGHIECLTKKIKTMCGKIETYCEKCCTDSLELMYVEWDDYGKKWSHYICTECEEEYWCDYYYGFD